MARITTFLPSLWGGGLDPPGKRIVHSISKCAISDEKLTIPVGWTDLHQMEGHRALIVVSNKINIPICCTVSKTQRFKSDYSRKSSPNFALFCPPPLCNTGGVGEMSESIFRATPMI